MHNLRKALVISVMSFTVLSMCVVVAPKAEAAAVAGDLIKMSGLSSVYYLAADGKRYVFPNEQTYFSWYSDFSKVVTIPQSELETYPLGKNVTIRPGTKLVKITTDPKVYAVEPNGTLKHLPDEATAKTLFGDNWAKRVVDVSDAFFTNYTVGSGSVSATAYPAGSLVKFGTAPDISYIAADGTARKIANEAAFLANRFKWGDIITATIVAPAAGTEITGAEGTLTDTSSGAGGAAGAGTGITVSTSSDTPGSASIPSKATLVPFLTVNLTASNDGDVTINDLTFTRFGTGATTDFNGGYVYDGLNRLSTKRSVNSSDNTISFNALNLVVAAGKTRSITLRMDAATTGTQSGNHGFRLDSASVVKTNGAAVSGSFPIAGNIMTYSSSASVATVILTTGGGSGNRKVGETNVVLGTFDIENNAQEVVKIYHIKLKQDQDAGNSAINNLNLDLDGTIVASGVSMVDRYVDFILATPFEVKKSTTITATIRGDVISDIGKYVQLYLNATPDFDARGTAYGDFYSALVTNTSLDATNAETYGIIGSEINVSFDGPQAQDIKNDTTNVVLANFKILTQQDVNIETLTITSSVTGAGSLVMQNMEMVDSANSLSFSTDDEVATGTQTSAFENIYLKKGVQYNFAIRGDIQDGVGAGAVYQASINFSTGPFTARFQDTNETLVQTSDLSQTSLTGKNMTVAAPSVVMSKTSNNNQSAVKGSTGVLLYQMKITATNVDDLKVSKLTFDSNIGQPSTGVFSLDWSRLYLYAEDGVGAYGTKLDDESSLGNQIISFTGFTLNIPKGLSNGVRVSVRGDAKTSPSGTTTQLLLEAVAGDQTVKDSKNNSLTDAQKSITGATAGHITTVVTAGSFTMDTDTNESGVNADQNVLAGGIRKAGRIKITASKEPVIINDLVLENTGSAVNSTVAQLKLYSDSNLSNLLGTADVGTNLKALFQGIDVEIPDTGITYLYIGAMVKGIDYSGSPVPSATAAAGETIILKVASDATNYTNKISGKVTGDVLPNTGISHNSTKTSTVMGAVMSSITTSFANNLISTGIKEIFSFKVTAPASGNIDTDGNALPYRLNDVTFNVSTSTGITLSTFLVKRVGGANPEKAAKNASAAATAMVGSSFVVDFSQTYATTTDSDINIKPGETAEYIVSATVGGVDSNESLQVTIEGVDTNVKYYHSTGSNGTYLVDTGSVSPLLPGITSVRGGSLTN